MNYICIFVTSASGCKKQRVAFTCGLCTLTRLKKPFAVRTRQHIYWDSPSCHQCSRYSVVTWYISSPVILSGIDLQNTSFSNTIAIYKSNICQELSVPTNIFFFSKTKLSISEDVSSIRLIIVLFDRRTFDIWFRCFLCGLSMVLTMTLRAGIKVTVSAIVWRVFFFTWLLCQPQDS